MKKYKDLFLQAFRFSLVGVVNTLLDFAIYFVLTRLPFFANYTVFAHVISYSCGVVCSLVLNKIWTFAQKEPMTRRQLLCFLLVNLAALGVSSGAIAVYALWDMGALLAKILSVPFSLGVNFAGNKLLVFRKS